MAHVDVYLFAAARSAVGRDTVSVEPGTIDDIVAAIAAQAPAFADVHPRCSFLVDSLAVVERATRVETGSRLDVLPPFAGG